jgi:AbrB family looped-hinge helix DNA binding protein
MKLPFVRTVNAHGLVTIPAKMRHELGWKPGTRLVIAVAGNHFVLQSVKDWKKQQKQKRPTKPKSAKTQTAKAKATKSKSTRSKK